MCPVIQALESFIEVHTRQVEPLIIAQSEAYWRFTTTGRKEDEEEYARLTAALRKVYADRQAFARLRQLMEAAGLLKDGAFTPNPEVPPLLARQARILYDDFRGLQIDLSLIDAITELEKEVEGAFNTFRATLRGRPVTDNQIPRSCGIPPISCCDGRPGRPANRSAPRWPNGCSAWLISATKGPARSASITSTR